MENYEEDYEYDLAGNLEEIRHSVLSNLSRGWTRTQTFADKSNRILSSQVGNNPEDTFDFDEGW